MKNSIKKFSVLFLSFAFILCTLALTVFGFNSAKADVVAEFSVYQMEESVSIKQVENGGIRFRVKMDANTKALIDSADDVTYGFIITPVYFYENRAADTAETPAYGVDDYISSIAKYAGETGVGILGDKAKIYQENEGDEFYYANGVLEGIGNDPDHDLKYIAIAYVKDGSGFHYATFDADNAINIKTAASKIYLQEKSDIETIRKIDILADFGAETNPVLISDNADMYALSSATNSGVITGEEDAGTGVEETINFKLAKSMTLADDFTPVSADFNGNVIADRNTLRMKDASTHAFASHTEEGCGLCASKHEVLTISENTTDRLNMFNSGANIMSADEAVFVANADLPVTDGYAGNALKISGSTGIVYQVRLNYTAEELAEAKALGYNRVRFNVLFIVSNGVAVINSPNGVYNGLLQYSGVTSKGSYASTRNQVVQNAWKTYDVSIDNLIATIGLTAAQPDSAVIMRMYSTSELDLYLGDMSFATEDEEYLLKVDEYKEDRIFYSNVNTSEYKSAEDLASTSNYSIYGGDALYFSVPTYANSVAGHLMIKINYTRPELEEFLSDGKYNKVKIYVLACPMNGNGNNKQSLQNYLNGKRGSADWGSFGTNNKWAEVTMDLQDFITGAMDYSTDENVKYNNMAYIMGTSKGTVCYIGDIIMYYEAPTE